MFEFPYSLLKKSFVLRMTLLIAAFVSFGILSTALLAYTNLYNATAENAEIRIDRAGRTAVALAQRAFPERFAGEFDPSGTPVVINLGIGLSEEVLAYEVAYDALLQEIGITNQGAANLFRRNAETKAFDREVTTLRPADGSPPPAFSISDDHPAYASLSEGKAYVGNVPVMQRERLAFLIPIISPYSDVAGVLAVDVGWVDDLFRARDSLRSRILGGSAITITLVLIIMTLILLRETAPLRGLAQFSRDLANGIRPASPPFLNCKDEFGALAAGLAQVSYLQGELETAAYEDAVTKLPNRAALYEKLAQPSCLESRALLQISFTGLPKIKETFGTNAADDILQKIAGRLRAHLVKEEYAYRVSGDEFVLLWISPWGNRGADLDARARKLLFDLGGYYSIAQGDFYLQPYIGIARLPAIVDDRNRIIRDVSLALNEAKKSFDPEVSFFDEEMASKQVRATQLETALRQAIQNGEIEVVFQPQIRLEDGKVTGVEALARWPNGPGGEIDPEEFIELAERTGLIIDLGKRVLDECCRHAKDWSSQDLEFGHISVNISPTEIRQPGFRDHLALCLERHQLEPALLCLEITEGTFIEHDQHEIGGTFSTIRSMGILLALDDFGSGYASLNYLNRFLFTEVKIDRSFISGVDKDPDKKRLLEGMVGLLRTLDLHVVGEGVEEAAELSIVERAGCVAVQGYIFSKPLDAGAASQFLKDRPGLCLASV